MRRLTDLFQNNRDLFLPLTAFSEKLGKGPGALTPQERAWIGAYVSYLNECRVCFTSHSLNSRAGFQTEIDQAMADPRRAPILKLAEKLTLDQNRVTEEDRQAVLAAGWDERALQEIVTLIAYMGMINRLVSGLGITEMGRKRSKPVEY